MTRRLLLLGAATLAALFATIPAHAATGPQAQVFAPNPVADLGIQSLTDQKDSD